MGLEIPTANFRILHSAGLLRLPPAIALHKGMHLPSRIRLREVMAIVTTSAFWTKVCTFEDQVSQVQEVASL